MTGRGYTERHVAIYTMCSIIGHTIPYKVNKLPINLSIHDHSRNTNDIHDLYFPLHHILTIVQERIGCSNVFILANVIHTINIIHCR